MQLAGEDGEVLPSPSKKQVRERGDGLWLTELRSGPTAGRRRLAGGGKARDGSKTRREVGNRTREGREVEGHPAP